MKENLIFVFIGLIFIGMMFLCRQPLLARVMSDEEKIMTAIEHTFGGKGFNFYGSIKLSSKDESKSEIFQVNMTGAVTEHLKEIEFKVNSLQDMNDILVFNYFEDETVRCVSTPIDGFNKLIINKQQATDKIIMNKEALLSILNVEQVEVERNITTRINQNTAYPINIFADCYSFSLDKKVIIHELGVDNSLSNLGNKVQDIKMKIFIDEGLEIRKIVGVLGLEEIEVEIDFNLARINRDNTILKPDISDARVISSSFEELVGDWLN
ncbi:MAG: hypothetical protein CVV02_06545 [Firmicutes bacterium HGW-Firmicutes-7]|nr:MAG: hypothetical protein CVV02_06545 [Firmicutes bacterium HGW-Firmicutes-7]